MVPTVDRAKATVMTKVQFDALDPRILPEMSAKVAFLSQEVSPEQQQPLVAVSPDALAQRDGRTVIFVVRGDRAVAVPVTPGAKLGDLTAIVGEAKSGEKAVLRPAPDLADGAASRSRPGSARAMGDPAAARAERRLAGTARGGAARGDPRAVQALSCAATR